MSIIKQKKTNKNLKPKQKKNIALEKQKATKTGYKNLGGTDGLKGGVNTLFFAFFPIKRKKE